MKNLQDVVSQHENTIKARILNDFEIAMPDFTTVCKESGVDIQAALLPKTGLIFTYKEQNLFVGFTVETKSFGPFPNLHFFRDADGIPCHPDSIAFLLKKLLIDRVDEGSFKSDSSGKPTQYVFWSKSLPMPTAPVAAIASKGTPI